ncbi:MAG: DUF6152 family protein [Candidatus Rariloculaceae bacterium]
MLRLLTAAFGLVLATVAPLAGAHHGFAAHFDPDQLIRIEGTVKQFDFINPHSFLLIDSVNDAGEPVVYVCDLQARTQLARRGEDETLFTVGEPIVVEGFLARRDPYGCEFGRGTFADGSTFTMRSVDQARTQFAAISVPPLAEGASRTVFGTWIRPGMFGDNSGRGSSSGLDSVTEAGLAAREAFDPIADNPVNFCRGGSPIRNWGAPGLASRITQVNNEIYIYHESMDITRTVHMNMSGHPDNIEPSEMGYSIGRFEDGTLVVETANFSAGTITGSNMHSAQMTLVERISVTPDKGRLLNEWVINDPEFYSEPLTGSQELHPTDREIISYGCIPGAPEGYSH